MNRAIAPEIKPILKIDTHFPESSCNVFKIKSEEGVFKLDIVFPEAGQIKENNKFAIGMAINLLMSGNHIKSAARIAEEIDALGGFVFKSSDYYSCGISIYGLNDHIEETIRLTKNALDTVEYLDEEIAVYKKNSISELNINLQKTSYLASKGINTLLCGKGHDISYQVTEEIINETVQSELIHFKNRYLINPYFIFTGPEQTEIEKILTDNNFVLSKTPSIRHVDKVLNTEKESFLFIKKEKSTQNSIRFGAIWPKREHPDYFKLSILNLILGGFFGSRLMKNIREDKGLTYGIQSTVTPYNHYSLFKISCEFNSQFTEQLKNEIFNEINRLKNEEVEENELSVAKNYLLGVMLRSFDGAFPISDKFKQFLEANLSKDYYNQYFKAINAITSKDIKFVANNYLNENTLTYCLAGV